MRVSIPFDVLLGTLFSLLLVSKLSLVLGADYCQTDCTSLTDCIDNPCGCTRCYLNDDDYLGGSHCDPPHCGDPCRDESGKPNNAICAGASFGCTQCTGNDADGYFCTNPTCGLVNCWSYSGCIDQKESGCTLCRYGCTHPECGDDCLDDDGKPSHDICAGNGYGCIMCLESDYNYYTHTCQKPPDLPSSSPSSIPSQKPSALTKKKMKKTMTGQRKKAKTPTVPKKTHKAKK